MPPFRILVADDQEVVRCVVSSILSSRSGWEVCYEATNGQEAIDKVAALKPDVVLLDSVMPEVNGFQAARAILETDPSQKILILAPDATEQLARDAFDSGALGIVVKANAAHEVVSAVEAVRQGRTRFTPRLAELILNGYLKGGAVRESGEALSDRERQTVRLLAQEFSGGYGNQRRRGAAGGSGKAFAIAALVIAVAALGWTVFGRKLQEVRAMDQLLVSLHLKSIPAPDDSGNPDVRVWIDLHTALYYCPDSSSYGKTVKGKFTSQHEAQLDRFEPASGRPCE
jgi:DNA-binding NarL/FixJ family response regulator